MINNELERLRKENAYLKEVEQAFNGEREKNRDLETENQTLKIKSNKYSQQHQKAT